MTINRPDVTFIWPSSAMYDTQDRKKHPSMAVHWDRRLNRSEGEESIASKRVLKQQENYKYCLRKPNCRNSWTGRTFGPNDLTRQKDSCC